MFNDALIYDIDHVDIKPYLDAKLINPKKKYELMLKSAIVYTGNKNQPQYATYVVRKTDSFKIDDSTIPQFQRMGLVPPEEMNVVCRKAVLLFYYVVEHDI
jgi:hypothetical protein